MQHEISMYAIAQREGYAFSSHVRIEFDQPMSNLKCVDSHSHATIQPFECIHVFALSLGMDKAIEICKDRMSRYGVVPNIIVVPPSMLLYLSLAPEEKAGRAT